MDTAIKVFIWIGMIAGLWTIIAPVLGWLALKKIEKNEMDTTWKILVLLFVNLIAGILLFVKKDETANA